MSIKLLVISLLIIASPLQANWYFDDDEDEPKTGHEVKEVENFDALLSQAKKENKIIMLEMSATYCGYCKELEREIINPMLISGDYEHVIIRKLVIDGYHSIDMPNNQTTSPSKFARDKNVFVTPTLLFLNHNNEEVAERILGVNSIDYFGAYVDDALKLGIQQNNKALMQ